mmetsp:Transcript_17923/g.38459  ORF Transcript_17923/g.38459 Transcript_17923/m.38459 type:complete len:259 (-) Transcript_17923:978-1754(-)
MPAMFQLSYCPKARQMTASQRREKSPGHLLQVMTHHLQAQMNLVPQAAAQMHHPLTAAAPAAAATAAHPQAQMEAQLLAHLRLQAAAAATAAVEVIVIVTLLRDHLRRGLVRRRRASQNRRSRSSHQTEDLVWTLIGKKTDAMQEAMQSGATAGSSTWGGRRMTGTVGRHVTDPGMKTSAGMIGMTGVVMPMIAGDPGQTETGRTTAAGRAGMIMVVRSADKSEMVMVTGTGLMVLLSSRGRQEVAGSRSPWRTCGRC